MEDVKELLEDAALEIYVEVFENLGYDSLDHLLKMDPSALLDLKRLAKMREGHFVRLQTTINNWSIASMPQPHRAQQVLLQLQGAWAQQKWAHCTWSQPQPRWAQVVQ